MKAILVSLCVFTILANGHAQNVDSASRIKITPWFVEKFKVSAGFFLPINNTSIQVGINGSAQGTKIDFESDLGFNTSIGTFLANVQWRISPRSRVNFAYYKIDRGSTHTIDKDIIFKEDTFHANASVNSFFNTSIYQVSYGYAILSKPKYEAGLMIGAHLIGGKTGIALNGASTGTSKNDDFGFTAPLPDLGIWGGYAISSRLAVNVEGDYLSLTVGNYTGSILAYNIAFTYKVVDHLELMLGYTGLNCKVDVVKANANGHLKWGYNGPALAATYSFGKRPWSH